MTCQAMLLPTAQLDGAHLAGSPACFAGQPGSTLRVHSSSPTEWQVQQPIVASQVRKLLYNLSQIAGERDLHIEGGCISCLGYHIQLLVYTHNPSFRIFLTAKPMKAPGSYTVQTCVATLS